MRVAIHGDIGRPAYHVGDEAVTHAAVAQFAKRGVTDVLLFTHDVARTRRAHAGVDAALTLAVPDEPAARERYLDAVAAFAAGDPGAFPAGDRVHGVMEKLRGVDALFVAGGGAMNSRHGRLLTERAALAHLATALGKQVVLGGQTFGPDLSDADRVTLAGLLGEATLVGLREDHSLALARELAGKHEGLRPCLDDAGELAPPPGWARPVLDRPPLAATFAAPDDPTERGASARAYARLLDAASHRVGAPVLFLPHLATPGIGDGDEAFHAEIAAHLRAPHELAPIASALETAALTATCSGVVSSRYHPVIFALAGALGSVGVAADEYDRVRIAGAYARVGVDQEPIMLADLRAGRTIRSSWVAPLDRPQMLAPSLVSQYDRWWDAVVLACASTRGRRGKLLRTWLRSRRQGADRLARRLRG